MYAWNRHQLLTREQILSESGLLLVIYHHAQQAGRRRAEIGSRKGQGKTQTPRTTTHRCYRPRQAHAAGLASDWTVETVAMVGAETGNRTGYRGRPDDVKTTAV